MKRKKNKIEDVEEVALEEHQQTIKPKPSSICNEWNYMFGITGALAGISCKLGSGHEGEHEVIITFGSNPAIKNTLRWIPE